MIFPVNIEKGKTFWTAGSGDWRETHVHGGADIAAPLGTNIIAPADSTLRYYISHVTKYPTYMDRGGLGIWPFVNYRFEMYGLIAVLRPLEHDQSWIFCHMDPANMSSLFSSAKWSWWSAKQSNELWYFGALSQDLFVREKDIIGKVGNMGKTMTAANRTGSDVNGAHLHLEIHPGKGWVTYEKRIKPEVVYPEYWAKRDRLWEV